MWKSKVKPRRCAPRIPDPARRKCVQLRLWFLVSLRVLAYCCRAPCRPRKRSAASERFALQAQPKRLAPDAGTWRRDPALHRRGPALWRWAMSRLHPQAQLKTSAEFRTRQRHGNSEHLAQLKTSAGFRARQDHGNSERSATNEQLTASTCHCAHVPVWLTGPAVWIQATGHGYGA